jgi:hypothetical protein
MSTENVRHFLQNTRGVPTEHVAHVLALADLADKLSTLTQNEREWVIERATSLAVQREAKTTESSAPTEDGEQ